MSVPLALRALGRALHALIKAVDATNEWTGRLVAWAVVPLMGGLVYEVVARYVFGAPTLWAYDFTYMLYGGMFMVGAGYTLLKQGHIRTDMLYRLLPERWQALIDTLLYPVFFFPAVVYLLVVGIDFAEYSWSIREKAAFGAWRPPIYPLKTVVPVAAFLLLLQGASEFVKSIRAAVRGGWT